MLSPILAIQHIKVIWSKPSRGGSAAAIRNAVPETLALPPAQASPAHCVLQAVCYSEIDNFSDPQQIVQWFPEIITENVGCVALQQISSDIVRATFQYSRQCAGLPERGWMNDAFDASFGEWAQIVYNGRFTSVLGMVGPENQWWYEKHVVNIALMEQYDEGVFIAKPPTHRYSLMRQLF